jgi:hypothetical protein
MPDYGVVKTWRIAATSIEDAFEKTADAPPDQQETHVLPEVAAELQEYVVRRAWRVGAHSPDEAVEASEKKIFADRMHCVAPDDDHDPGPDGLLAEL